MKKSPDELSWIIVSVDERALSVAHRCVFSGEHLRAQGLASAGAQHFLHIRWCALTHGRDTSRVEDEEGAKESEKGSERIEEARVWAHGAQKGKGGGEREKERKGERGYLLG